MSKNPHPAIAKSRWPGTRCFSSCRCRDRPRRRKRTLSIGFAASRRRSPRAPRRPSRGGASRRSVRDMLDLGLARILMPARFGGYDLDFDTWNDAVVEISKADASHGWCASLIVHHAHLIAQFPEEAQQAVWADGPDVAVAASFAPRAKAVRVPGGYRLTGDNSSYASGVDHCSWVMVGAMTHDARRAGLGVLHGPAWRLHGARHLVHRRDARHRQQDHRHR